MGQRAKPNENRRRQNLMNKLACDKVRSEPKIKVGGKVLVKNHFKPSKEITS